MSGELRADCLRFHREPTAPGRARVLRLVADHFGLQALVVYRANRWMLRRAATPGRWGTALRALARGAARCSAVLHGIYLDPEADIGPGLYIGHSGGIHLARCRIGAGCSIHQRVRIDAAPGRDDGPTIGDRVWIGCHATIAGAVRVGDGATVAAGAMVDRDVAGRALIVGSPGRVIDRDYDNSALL